jgi:hypothetical protein
MKCFELRDDVLVRGLLIDEAEGSPRINVNASEYMALEPDLARFFLHRVEKKHPVRLHKTTVTEKGLGFCGADDHTALVRIDVSAEPNNLVTLTGSSYTEKLIGKEVKRLWFSFPPPGVAVLEEGREIDSETRLDESNVGMLAQSWTVGAKRLELVVTMSRGAGFRVHRTGRPKKFRRDLFLEWNGYEMKMRPTKGQPIEERVAQKEERPMRRETLLPAVGLA